MTPSTAVAPIQYTLMAPDSEGAAFLLPPDEPDEPLAPAALPDLEADDEGDAAASWFHV